MLIEERHKYIGSDGVNLLLKLKLLFTIVFRAL